MRKKYERHQIRYGRLLLPFHKNPLQFRLCNYKRFTIRNTSTSFYIMSITEEEYERAVVFLRNFHSRRAVTTSCSSLSSPLGAIDESGSDKSISSHVHDRSGMGQSTSIKKTAASMCLVDLDTPLGLNAFSSMRINASRR